MSIDIKISERSNVTNHEKCCQTCVTKHLQKYGLWICFTTPAMKGTRFAVMQQIQTHHCAFVQWIVTSLPKTLCQSTLLRLVHFPVGFTAEMYHVGNL